MTTHKKTRFFLQKLHTKNSRPLPIQGRIQKFFEGEVLIFFCLNGEIWGFLGVLGFGGLGVLGFFS